MLVYLLIYLTFRVWILVSCVGELLTCSAIITLVKVEVLPCFYACVCLTLWLMLLNALWGCACFECYLAVFVISYKKRLICL